jgi:signal transduction histidine kinase
LNLVQNSLKHGFEGIVDPQIDITASLEKNTFNTDDLEMLRIVYRDNGVGIKDSHQKSIYDPFFTTKRHEGGSGLGMSIIYNLVTERLGGHILCDSIINEYTQFDITFPNSITSEVSIVKQHTES